MKTSVKVRRLLAKGLKPADVAKKLKIKASYVHTIKWLDSKKDKKQPKKLIVQPQYKEAALKLLGMKEADPVNHPPHYTAGGVETIDFIEAKDLNYRLGNVVKYVSRAGKKDTDPVQDLEKALFYLKREIEARKSA